MNSNTENHTFGNGTKVSFTLYLTENESLTLKGFVQSVLQRKYLVLLSRNSAEELIDYIDRNPKPEYDMNTDLLYHPLYTGTDERVTLLELLEKNYRYRKNSESSFNHTLEVGKHACFRESYSRIEAKAKFESIREIYTPGDTILGFEEYTEYFRTLHNSPQRKKEASLKRTKRDRLIWDKFRSYHLSDIYKSLLSNIDISKIENPIQISRTLNLAIEIAEKAVSVLAKNLNVKCDFAEESDSKNYDPEIGF